MKIKRFSLSVDEDTYEQIENIVKKTNKSRADVTRDLIQKGLTDKVTESNTDLIVNIVRQQMEEVLKPHIEKLAELIENK